MIPSAASRRGFTLMELLIVIMIILVLMGLLIPAISMARRAAQKAKATTLLANTESAINQFRSLNATWPERWPVPANGDARLTAIVTALTSGAGSSTSWTSAAGSISTVTGADAYALVFSTDPSRANVAAKAASSITPDNWAVINAVLVSQLGSLISDTAPKGMLIDPWGQPLRYRPAKWYPYSGVPETGATRIDSIKPPNEDTYQLWSTGINGADPASGEGYGETGDDMPNWKKQD
jgi:prepilin-type N-terminal cleavage/methylation domain-containing protein